MREDMSFLAVTTPNLAQDDGAGDFVLGGVVRGRNRRVIEEGEQRVLVLVDVLGQLEVFRIAVVARGERKHRLPDFGHGLDVEGLRQPLARFAQLDGVLQRLSKATGDGTSKTTSALRR